MAEVKVCLLYSDNIQEPFMVNDYILNTLKRIDMLPTFPDIVGEIISIIDDPRSSASDLAKHMDPSMVGEVVRIANTAYFGTGAFKKIVTLEHAIAVIGYQHLSNIILHMPFIAMAKGDEKSFNRNEFIKHSIACGVLSKAISLRTRIGNQNEVYISGIMHDIGVIVIYRYFRNEWQAIQSLISREKMSRIEAEREVFSVDHGFIGAALLDLWSIPKAITDGVRFHHAPEGAKENKDNVMITHMGNMFTRSINFKDDLNSFNDFMSRHRSFMGSINALGKSFSSGEEVSFFEHIYGLLREVKGYTEGIIEETDD
ncbi:MAG: hypothetical protein C0392_06625 [Syntrophus sp. (in: bacteria)]|nr:hypothetical protein [Syntrophus sp. (in: bacteria)]